MRPTNASAALKDRRSAILAIVWVIAAAAAAYRWLNWEVEYAVLLAIVLAVVHSVIGIQSGSGAIAVIFLLPVTVLLVFFLTGVKFIMREPTDGNE